MNVRSSLRVFRCVLREPSDHAVKGFTKDTEEGTKDTKEG